MAVEEASVVKKGEERASADVASCLGGLGGFNGVQWLEVGSV